MSLSVVEGLISVIVPYLISEAEKLLGNQNGVPATPDPVWVKGLVQEVFSLFEKYIPSFLQPEEALVEQLIADAVSKVINKK